MSQANDLFNDSMLLASAVKIVAGIGEGRVIDDQDFRAIDLVLTRLYHLEKLSDAFHRMRKAQVEYFRSKTGFEACRALEREVDKLLRVGEAK